LGFFGFTGACGVRTAVGETPPVVEPLDVGLFVPDEGETPPAPDEEVPLEVPLEAPLGAVVPPVAAAAEDTEPHARASASTATASIERKEMHPCMGHGIGPAVAGA
jgi:hypothetical protein